MKRRKLLGFGAVVFGGSLVAGTGAFNTARTERNVAVSVVGDRKAYLELTPTEVFGRSSTVSEGPDDPGLLVFRIPGTDEPSEAGDGIGLDSEYYFDDLLDIQNNGTERIEVSTEFNDERNEIVNIDLFVVENGRTHLRGNPIELDSGEEQRVGLYIESGDGDLGEFDLSLQIIGKAIPS